MGIEKQILVTGGAGFIGSHIVDGLIESGSRVVVLDNLSSGRLSNLDKWIHSPRLEFVKGDITDSATVSEVLANSGAVFHEAAIVSLQRGLDDPGLMRKVNIEGTGILLECAAEAHVKRLIFASSAAVYGKTKRLPVSEEAPTRPISLYGETKLEGEMMCLAFHEKTGIQTTILRYFNVYGPRMLPGSEGSVVAKFADRIRGKKPPIVYGSGMQTRDFVNVRDVARANILALPCKDTARILNIGSGCRITINELLDLESREMTSSSSPSIHVARRSQEIMHSWADISLARKLLGYSPQVGLAEGLREYQDWLNESEQRG